jgi:hypothetical protein
MMFVLPVTDFQLNSWRREDGFPCRSQLWPFWELCLLICEEREHEDLRNGGNNVFLAAE